MIKWLLFVLNCTVTSRKITLAFERGIAHKIPDVVQMAVSKAFNWIPYDLFTAKLEAYDFFMGNTVKQHLQHVPNFLLRCSGRLHTWTFTF